MKPAGRARHRGFQLLAATILTISWALPGRWPVSAKTPAAVRVTSGEHPGFGRVVLDAPGLAYIPVNRDGGHLVIRFPDDPALGNCLPRHTTYWRSGQSPAGWNDRAARRRCSHVADWRQGHRGHQRPGAGSSAVPSNQPQAPRMAPTRRARRNPGNRGRRQTPPPRRRRANPPGVKSPAANPPAADPPAVRPAHQPRPSPPRPSRARAGTSKPAEPAAGWKRSDSRRQGHVEP